jgi:hypothetical protein
VDSDDDLESEYLRLTMWMTFFRYTECVLLWALILLIPIIAFVTRHPDFELAWSAWGFGALFCTAAHFLRIYYRRQAALVHQHLYQEEEDENADTDID